MNKTKIEWADVVWNPVTGCTPVSEGCRNCYAKRMAKRLAGRYGYPTAPDEFKVTLHPDRLEEPLRWRKPRRVFVDSMGDLFHEEVPFEFVDQVFYTMMRAPWHTFMILTKRPERMNNYIESRTEHIRFTLQLGGGIVAQAKGNYLGNVWMGVSVEDQKSAEERITTLQHIPAAVRFVSCEPLVNRLELVRAGGTCETAWDEVNADPEDAEPEEFVEECEAEADWVNYGNDLVINPEYKDWLEHRTQMAKFLTFKYRIDWVIVGGETGPGARPMHPDWARRIRDECVNAEVPFFFKGWGEYSWGFFVGVRAAAVGKVGKKRAGRLLDGREWNQFPGGG